MIVSEETGTISVAIGGMLKRHLAPQTMEKLLTNELLSDEDRRNNTLLGWLRNRFAGKAESHEEK